MDMDQETAKFLLHEGATFIFLGVPQETEFGIDMKSWNTTEDFRGIKMIPPGIHFVHFSAVSKDSGDVSPRSGFMHNFQKREFLVKIWDKEKEDLSPDEVSEDSVAKLKENLYNLDRHLAPYPYDIWEKWKSLSCHLNEDLIARLSPESRIIRSSVDLLSMDDKDRPRGSKTKSEKDFKCNGDTSVETVQKKKRLSSLEDMEKSLLPNLKPAPGTGLRLTKIPDERHPQNATPQEITKHHLDQSYTLGLIISKLSDPMELIGELQFAYICFLIGHSLDAFEHWKNIVSLLCSCEDALEKYNKLYFRFLNCLEIQVYEMPEEFLADIVMNNNLVYRKLRDLFKTAYVCKVDSRFLSCIDKLKNNLTLKFGWDFTGLEADEDDEKPVVVQL